MWGRVNHKSLYRRDVGVEVDSDQETLIFFFFSLSLFCFVLIFEKENLCSLSLLFCCAVFVHDTIFTGDWALNLMQ